MRTPKCTKSHFILIADVIKHLDVSPVVRGHIAKEFCRALGGTNPMFDRATFTSACMTDAEKAVDHDAAEELRESFRR